MKIIQKKAGNEIAQNLKKTMILHLLFKKHKRMISTFIFGICVYHFLLNLCFRSRLVGVQNIMHKKKKKDNI